MKAIVIMLHNPFNEKIVFRQFLNAFKEWSAQIQIISIPMPQTEQGLVVDIDRLKAALKDKVQYDDVCAFVIESNYGHPSLEEVNFDLLQFGLTTFLNAKIIAYSSTKMSLVMGAKLDDNISVCHSTSASIDDIVSFFAQALALDDSEIESLRTRVFTRNIAKELTQLNVGNENLNFNEHSKTFTFQFNAKDVDSSFQVTHATENNITHIHSLSDKPHRL